MMQGNTARDDTSTSAGVGTAAQANMATSSASSSSSTISVIVLPSGISAPWFTPGWKGMSGKTRPMKVDQLGWLRDLERDGHKKEGVHDCPLCGEVSASEGQLLRHLSKCRPRTRCYFCEEKRAFGGRGYTAAAHRGACLELKSLKIEPNDAWGIYAWLLLKNKEALIDSDTDNQFGVYEGTVGKKMREIRAVLVGRIHDRLNEDIQDNRTRVLEFVTAAIRLAQKKAEIQEKIRARH